MGKHANEATFPWTWFLSPTLVSSARGSPRANYPVIIGVNEVMETCNNEWILGAHTYRSPR